MMMDKEYRESVAECIKLSHENEKLQKELEKSKLETEKMQGLCWGIYNSVDNLKILSDSKDRRIKELEKELDTCNANKELYKKELTEANKSYYDILGKLNASLEELEETKKKYDEAVKDYEKMRKKHEDYVVKTMTNDSKEKMTVRIFKHDLIPDLLFPFDEIRKRNAVGEFFIKFVMLGNIHLVVHTGSCTCRLILLDNNYCDEYIIEIQSKDVCDGIVSHKEKLERCNISGLLDDMLSRIIIA